MLYYGNNEATLYYGNNELQGMYYGSELIYPTTISGLQITANASVNGISGGTATIYVRSESDWNITYDPSKTWITSIYPSSGTAGRTAVTITTSGTGSFTAETAILTATTTDEQYSATCTLTAYAMIEGLINFNAKNYNASTHTIPKSEYATVDWDLVFDTNRIQTVSSDNIYLYGLGKSSDNTLSVKNFGSEANNPFNITSDNKEITIICKVSSANEGFIFSNRSYGGSYDYRIMCDGTDIHMDGMDTSTGVKFSTVPNIVVFTADATSNYMYSYTDDIMGDVKYTKWNWAPQQKVYMFHGGYGSEAATIRFYWIYVVRRKLSTGEIQAVINYNENL